MALEGLMARATVAQPRAGTKDDAVALVLVLALEVVGENLQGAWRTTPARQEFGRSNSNSCNDGNRAHQL